MSAHEFIAKTASNYYVVATVFLLDTIVQWMLFEYMNISKEIVEVVNLTRPLAPLGIATIGIICFRVQECTNLPLYIKILIAFILVQLIIFGGYTLTLTTSKILIISFVTSTSLFIVFSSFGYCMKSLPHVMYLGILITLILLALMIGLLIATLFSLLQSQLGFIKVLLMFVVLIVIFSVAFDSHDLNNLKKEDIFLGDSLRYGLYIYGEYIALFMINLTQFQMEY